MEHADGYEENGATLNSGTIKITQTRQDKGKSTATVDSSNSNARATSQVPKPNRQQTKSKGNGSSASGSAATKAPTPVHQMPNPANKQYVRTVGDARASSSANNHPPRQTYQARNRGGRQPHSRGGNSRDRRGGQGQALDFSADDIWMDHTGSSGIFHFGSGHSGPESRGQDTANGMATGHFPVYRESEVAPIALGVPFRASWVAVLSPPSSGG
nr:hypothetical protein Iba_scaffold45541CG0010 [Ipomoea batatas]